MALRTDSIFKKDTLHDHSILFCLQYSFLHRHDGQVWRMTPKTHLFLELGLEAAAGGQPETCWTYRDEDFGGTCAHFARRRGAPCTVPGFSHAVITRFVHRPVIYVNCKVIVIQPPAEEATSSIGLLRRRPHAAEVAPNI